MKPFLYQVASLFYSEYGAEVSRLAFVFPNRRTGLFFQKYLSESGNGDCLAVERRPGDERPGGSQFGCTVDR